MKIRLGNTSRGRAMRPIEAVIFGLVFTLCGVALLFYSFQTIKDYKEKDAKYIEVSAEVVDYKENSEGLLAIIAEYEVDGQKYSKTGSTFSNSPKSIGSRVSVKYNPKNPKDSIWKNDSTNLVLPLVSTGFTLVGLLIFITGILGFKDKNKKDSSDEVNKAINDFETSQNENNIVDNTLGAVAAPLVSALNNTENVSVSNETTQVNGENKVGELEQPVTVSKSKTEEVVPTVEQNVVSENNNNEIQGEKPVEVTHVVEAQQVVETISNAEPLNESIPQPVVTSEPVVENVVPNVEQNVVSENNNNEIQGEKPVEVTHVVEAQQVVETISNAEPLNESIPQPVVTSEPVVENVVPTVEQNVQQSVNNNNEIQVEKSIEVTSVAEAQPVVETISNVEHSNETIPQPVVTSEPVVENVVPNVEQNVVVENTTTNEVPVEIVPSVETIKDETVKPVIVNETVAENVVPNVEQNVQQSVNNNNEIQIEKPIEVAPVVESQPVVETIPNVEALNDSIPQSVVTSEPVVENIIPTVEQNVAVENTTTNEVPVEIVPSIEPIKEETVKPVTVNEQVVENVIPNVEQNVQQPVNNNM